MLSTMYTSLFVKTEKRNYTTDQKIFKPNVVVDYNKNMSGVDLLDQVTTGYPSTRITIKWYKKVFLSWGDPSKNFYRGLIIFFIAVPEEKFFIGAQ